MGNDSDYDPYLDLDTPPSAGDDNLAPTFPLIAADWDDENNPVPVTAQAAASNVAVVADNTGNADSYEDIDNADADADASGGTMGLGDHLAELRGRLAFCLALALPLLMLGLVFHKPLWDLLILPARDAVAQFDTSAGAFERYFELRPQSPTDPLFVVFKLSLFCTLMVLLPGLLYQAWRFVAPGLKAAERRALRRIFGAGAFLFAGGVAVGWRFGAPTALAFLLSFSAGLPAVRNLYSMDSYMGFLSGVSLAFGVAFETPLAMWALARAGLLRTRHLRRWWRQIVLGVFVLAAVLTPPDPFSQILLATVLILLLFAGYFLVHAAQKKDA